MVRNSLAAMKNNETFQELMKRIQAYPIKKQLHVVPKCRWWTYGPYAPGQKK